MAERLLLGQHGGQQGIGHGQVPPAGGVEAGGAGLHGGLHAGVLQVHQPVFGLKVGWHSCQQTGAGVDHIALVRAQQGVQVVAAEQGVGGFKTGLAERGLAGALPMAQVGGQHAQVGAGAGPGAVAAYAACQLDERAHGRGLDHGPVVIVVAAHFGDGRAEHDEQVVGLGMRVNALADVGQAEHGIRLAAVQGLVKLLFDGRAQQQRVLRVVGTQVDAHALGCALLVQRQRHVHQRLDVGHADEAEADALATCGAAAGVDAVVPRMQRQRGLAGQLGKAGGVVARWELAHIQRDQGGAAAHFALGGLGQVLGAPGGKEVVGAGKCFVVCAVSGVGAEFVHPQAADGG